MRRSTQLKELVAKCDAYWGGDADLAVHEAFRRESAIALELVVKAVIADKLQARGADPAKEGVRGRRNPAICLISINETCKNWPRSGRACLKNPSRFTP
jgi:hypothetical protein